MFMSAFPAFLNAARFATLVIHSISRRIIRKIECTVKTVFMLSQISANS